MALEKSAIGGGEPWQAERYRTGRSATGRLGLPTSRSPSLNLLVVTSFERAIATSTYIHPQCGRT